ncbi:MAG: DUF4439 domain-containing protein [Propionibacteriales bacterium]|nr:DUF4439 domain-containing protein [Propionibacteriales bacterium]
MSRQVTVEEDALQASLAAEHAAVFGYGVVGGRIVGVAPASFWQGLAVASYDAHRDLRDRLVTTISRLGGTPVSAEPAYDLPTRVDNLRSCQQLARMVESRCAAVHAAAVAVTVPARRSLVAKALSESAVRGVRWEARVAALPGIDG